MVVLVYSWIKKDWIALENVSNTDAFCIMDQQIGEAIEQGQKIEE